MKKRTRIICTIGPASNTLPILKRMANAGMAIARLNFSHGSHKDHHHLMQLIRKLNHTDHHNVKILQDLEGFRIRVGRFKGRKTLPLKKNQTVYMTNDPKPLGKNIIPFDYEGDLKDIQLKSSVFIDDGNIVLMVKSRSKRSLKAEVIIPGILKERKGINISDLRMPYKGMTEKDKTDLEFGLENKVDFVAQSFVRSARDVKEVKDRILKNGSRAKVIAKIENQDGINNFDSILQAADGIMVARGDMGVALPIYKIPIIQKWMIYKCNQKKKMVITATQMLESMTEHWRPTRAEVTDVANAVLDGTNFVMLSGESAAGKYPVKTVEMMQQIVLFTEKFRKRIHIRIS
jgi:pyruvate kinase